MFLQMVVTVSLALAAYGTGAVHLDPRIIGGRIVSTNKLFPYIVSIRTSDNVHFCTGSIISMYYVLTAASCFNSTRSKPNDLLIYYDTTKSSGEEGSLALVEEISIHPNYNNEATINDIALIRAKRPLYELSLFDILETKRVRYGSAHVGQELVVGSWGSESKDTKNFSTHLKQLTLKVVADDPHNYECTNVNNFFCAVDVRNDGTACDNDQGAPVVDMSQEPPALVGIVPEKRKGCISGTPTFYTRIENYRSWIDSHLGTGTTIGIKVLNTISDGQSILRWLGRLSWLG